jgi:DnaJ-class molecular chaperone
MIKVQVLTQCEHCNGKAYVPIDEAENCQGHKYTRMSPAEELNYLAVIDHHRER